jgi:pyruvate/2-oxoacid:ferredoxin oxidoreductase alpha subunit
MTATAGPGISLMSEFAGLAYYVEVPGVIWDIQRVGPSTGLPTRTSQGDILSTAFLSHGDTKHIMLLPCSVTECFTMAPEAFNLAEQFQTLVFVMSDLDTRPHQSIAAKFSARKTSTASADLRVTKTWTATVSVIARCLEPFIPQQPTSRAAAVTTREPSTASAPTISKTTWSA